MKRRLFIAAAISTPLIAVALLIIMILRSRADAAGTDELLAQWQAAGGALTLAELKPDPIPDNQNAAVLYEQAFAIMDNLTEEQINVIHDGELNSISVDALDQARDAVNMVIQAASRSDCRWESHIYGYSFSRVIVNVTRNTGNARSLSRLISLEAQRAIEAGSTQRGIELLAANRALGINIMHEQTLIAMLTGLGIESRVLKQFKDNYADRQLPTVGVEELLTPSLSDDLLRRIVFFDGTFLLDALRAAKNGDLTENEYHQEMQFALQKLLLLLAQFELPIPSRDFSFLDSSTFPKSFEMSRMGLSVWIKIMPNIAYVRKQHLAARLAIDLRRYRDDHGEYPDPETWDMPIDPMTGQSLLYRRTEGGIEILDSTVAGGHRTLWKWN